MKKKTAIIITVCGVAVALPLVLLALGSARLVRAFTTGLNKTYYIQVERQWKQRIEEVGTVQAYVELKERLAGSSTEIAHGVTHVFGELLYEKDGLAGLSVCDDTFNYACYHGFITWAINYEGMDVLDRISERCTSLFGERDTFCRHGIGHGVFEYLGPDKLEEGLSACDRIGNTSYAGCYNGVMMQFINNEGYSTERLSLDRPYAICRGLTEPHRPACYFQNAYWWAWKTKKRPARLAELCHGLAGEERTACLLGTGKSLTEFSGYKVEESVKRCAGFADAEDRLLCEAGAAWVYKVLKRDPGSLCSGFGDEGNAACRRFAEGIGEDRVTTP